MDLALALNHANRVCDWQENLAQDEMPPAWMWPFEDELELWFEEVERRRSEKYGTSRSEDESVPMMQNELAKSR